MVGRCRGRLLANMRQLVRRRAGTMANQVYEFLVAFAGELSGREARKDGFQDARLGFQLVCDFFERAVGFSISELFS